MKNIKLSVVVTLLYCVSQKYYFSLNWSLNTYAPVRHQTSDYRPRVLLKHAHEVIEQITRIVWTW